ncbi:MAG: hypothetical protein AAGE01_11205 [Pseudomonadota bacterium]
MRKLLPCLLLVVLWGCAAPPAEPGSGRTDVFHGQAKDASGQDLVILLTLYPDGSGFVARKILGAGPPAGQLVEGSWEWSPAPRRVLFTPADPEDATPLVFLPADGQLIYAGRGGEGERFMLIRER